MSLIGDVLLPGSLWFIMFSMGLSLTLSEFNRVFTHRKALILGMASMLFVLPVIGILAAFFLAPTAALAVGFVLLATCPGGMLSNLMTDIAKGDLALSVSLTFFVSLIYIFVVPFYAYAATTFFLGVDELVEIPLLESVWKVFSITLVPVTLGVIVRRYRPTWALAIKPAIKWVATTVLVIAFLFILRDQIETLKATFGRLFLMVVITNLAALFAAFFLSIAAKISESQRTAICIEHIIRQEGTAIYIAVGILGNSEMSLPMIINTPVALIICIAFVTGVRMRRPGLAKIGIDIKET